MESSAPDTIGFTAPPPQPPTLVPNAYFTTFLGLFIAFSIFLTGGAALQALGAWLGLSRSASWILSSSADKVICIAVLLGFVIFVERRSIRSVGLVPLTRKDFGLGLLLFVAILIVSVGFGLLLYFLVPGFRQNFSSEQAKLLRSVPIALLMFDVFINGFFEEIGARGYAIDRLQAATGSLFLACAVALFLDLAAHIPFWGWKHAIVILPGQTLFVLMYLWRGDISACIVAHIVFDASVMVAATALLPILSLITPHGTLASRAFDRADYKTAIAEYSKALELEPADAKFLLGRARAEYQDSEFGAALQDLDEVLRREPANVEAYDTRALAYYGTGIYELAVADANEAVRRAPEKSDPYDTRAYLFEERRQYDKAAADLSAAIKYSNPSDADLYRRRGTDYLNLSDYDHAIADLTEVAKLDGEHSATLIARASAYLGKQQDDRAIADLTRALQIDPKAWKAYLDRATAYQNRRQYNLAIADLTRAMEAAPDNSDSQNALAWFLSTCPDPKYRNGKDALTHANKACDLSYWQDGQEVDTLAAAFAELGNFSQAVMWEQRAIALMNSESSEQQQDAAKRLELYKAKKPYRDTHPAAAGSSNGASALLSRPRPARQRLERIASISARSSLIGASSSVVTHPTEPAECESEPATSASPSSRATLSANTFSSSPHAPLSTSIASTISKIRSLAARSGWVGSIGSESGLINEKRASSL
jgi:tetratricopeptide (TPR) repeat protein/membrane protease YdiL (CAAX protease family)